LGQSNWRKTSKNSKCSTKSKAQAYIVKKSY
jgi:hypothetical protein